MPKLTPLETKFEHALLDKILDKTESEVTWYEKILLSLIRSYKRADADMFLPSVDSMWVFVCYTLVDLPIYKESIDIEKHMKALIEKAHVRQCS